MSITMIISLVLVILLIASLPIWKFSSMWGGGYTPTIFVAFMLGAHIFTAIIPSTGKPAQPNEPVSGAASSR